MTTSYEDKSEDRNTTTSEQIEPMKEQVEAIKQDTIRTGQKYADSGKNTAADFVTDFADALQSAAEELDSKKRNTSAEYIRFASEKIRKVSHSLRQKSVNQILNQASSYGKRQPVLFIGGAMLAGYPCDFSIDLIEGPGFYMLGFKIEKHRTLFKTPYRLF